MALQIMGPILRFMPQKLQTNYLKQLTSKCQKYFHSKGLESSQYIINYGDSLIQYSLQF